MKQLHWFKALPPWLCIRLSLSLSFSERRRGPRPSRGPGDGPWTHLGEDGRQGARFYSLMESGLLLFFNLSNLRDHRCCDCCCCDSLKLHNTETFLCGSLFPLSMHFITQGRGWRRRLFYCEKQNKVVLNMCRGVCVTTRVFTPRLSLTCTCAVTSVSPNHHCRKLSVHTDVESCYRSEAERALKDRLIWFLESLKTFLFLTVKPSCLLWW